MSEDGTAPTDIGSVTSTPCARSPSTTAGWRRSARATRRQQRRLERRHVRGELPYQPRAPGAGTGCGCGVYGFYTIDHLLTQYPEQASASSPSSPSGGESWWTTRDYAPRPHGWWRTGAQKTPSRGRGVRE